MNKPANVWAYKPWWCQPWSIVLTGCGLIGGSWWLTKLIWVTVVVGVPVFTWMGFFLIVYPRWMMNSNLLPDPNSESDD